MSLQPATSDSSASLLAWSRVNRSWLLWLGQVGLFVVCLLLAFGLAYNFRSFDTWFRPFFLPLLPFVLAIKAVVFTLFGLHRSSWRYVSLRDMLRIAAAAWWSWMVITAAYYFVINLPALGVKFDAFEGDFPDSVLVLDFAGTIALLAAARLSVRLYHEEVQPIVEGSAPKLLLLGAGNAGENVVREINRQPAQSFRIVGFLDDDRSKWGTTIHGVEVLGGIHDIKKVCDDLAVDEILIAMPSASKDAIRRVVELCQGTNLRFKTLPAITDLIAGRAKVQQIRDVDINDLLGRAPVRLDEDNIARFILGRTVMVTGAGGSIGSEMCRQIARYKPAKLLLVEQSEQNLFEIDRELRADFAGVTMVPYIADIIDRQRMTEVFRRERPTAVFHAAAHKHVPMMEYNPGEAIKNNVRGTRTVADLAAESECEKFVMISTDKAVNPTSIMGASKRLAEMYIQALNERTRTQFVTVRFGNVLGSSGSVVPIFKQQIERGGPVMVTHPDMVRYFMTIPEAAQLVLQSASMGNGGEIFVLDMGEPVKILDLARDLITLSGFRPDDDIKIEFSGVRPGEKLFEELSIEGEDVSRTQHPKVGIWQKRSEDWSKLIPALDAIVADADGLTREAARERIKLIVPEFHMEPPAPLPAKAVQPAPQQQPAHGTIRPAISNN